MRITKKLAELFLSRPERSQLKQQEHAEEGSSSSGSCVPVEWRKPGEQARKARASLQNAGSAEEGLANGHAKWACPSQQSSAAQTPSSTRPSSKEHQRSSSGSDTLSERDEQDAQRGPQGKDSLDVTHVSLAAPGLQFAMRTHEDPVEEAPTSESEDESAIPDLKRVIGDMRLHIDHPVGHPSNARGCVFKAYWSNACVAVKIVPSTAPPSGLQYLGYCVDRQQLNHPNIVQMFESRTGRASIRFLQPCALTLSPFSSCSEALEELCPSSIMDAVLAASDAAATGGSAPPTAAAAAMLGSPHASPSPGKRPKREGQQQHRQDKQEEQQQLQQQQRLSFSTRNSSKRSSSSGTLDMFDSGDGFGVPNAAKSERTSPMEWSQIMREAGVRAGDYVTLTLMDWCDCGTLHHAMAHAVFSLAPSRPASSSGSCEDGVLGVHQAPRGSPRPHSSGSVPAPDESSQGTSCCSAAQVSQDCMVSSSGSTAGSASVRGMRTRYRGLLRTSRDIAQGLEYLHARGIVHGALDPSNVLLKGSIADARGFVARLTNYNTSMEKARQAPSELTAPEVREGQVGCMQPAADMWSFGTLLRIMINCSLEAAHPGLDCGLSFGGHSKREECLQGMPTTLIPLELTDLYNRCVATDPAERPTARDAVMLLVAMEVRLRSKLGRQVWLHQQAHEQEWEETKVLARAVELQQQCQQTREAQAAHCEQLQQLDAQQQHLWLQQQQQQQQLQALELVHTHTHTHDQPVPQHQQLLYTEGSSVAAALSAVQQRLQAVHEQRVHEELAAAHSAGAQQQQQLQQEQQRRWPCQATLHAAPSRSGTSECTAQAPLEPRYQGMHSLVQQGAVLHPAEVPNGGGLGEVAQQVGSDPSNQIGCNPAQQITCDAVRDAEVQQWQLGVQTRGVAGVEQQAEGRRTSQDLQALLSGSCSATHTSATTTTAAHTVNTATTAATLTASHTCEQPAAAAAAAPAQPSRKPEMSAAPLAGTSGHTMPQEDVTAAMYAHAATHGGSSSPPAHRALCPHSPYVDAGSAAHVQHWQQALALQQILARQANPLPHTQLLELQEAAVRLCQQQHQQQQQQAALAVTPHLGARHAPAVPHIPRHTQSQAATPQPQQLHPAAVQRAQSLDHNHYQQHAATRTREQAVLAAAALEQHTAGALTQAALTRHLLAQQHYQQQLSQAAMQLHLRLRRAVRVSLHGGHGAHEEGSSASGERQQQQRQQQLCAVEQAVREADAAAATAGYAQC